jgi:hypothetical protein
MPTPQPTATGSPSPKLVQALDRVAHEPWQLGTPYVLAPAMTAIVAAAAEALDLTDEIVAKDTAPDDGGVLFLPEPIYHRGHRGDVTSIGAITWATSKGPMAPRCCTAKRSRSSPGERGSRTNPRAVNRRQAPAGRCPAG